MTIPEKKRKILSNLILTQGYDYYYTINSHDEFVDIYRVNETIEYYYRTGWYKNPIILLYSKITKKLSIVDPEKFRYKKLDVEDEIFFLLI